MTNSYIILFSTEPGQIHIIHEEQRDYAPPNVREFESLAEAVAFISANKFLHRLPYQIVGLDLKEGGSK